MQFFKNFVIGVAILLVLLIIGGFMLPDATHIERKIIINAKPAAIFTEINSVRELHRWSPWSQLDPDAVTKYSGPTTGVGSRMEWTGNAAIGSGSQEIIESVPDQRVKTQLVFSGYDHPASSTFQLKPVANGTEVIWMYDTSMGYDLVSRYFGLMLDRWLGKDYEKGLVTLTHLVENEHNPAITEGQRD
ncbi:MAG: SRPBCC family protein [Stenotrophobium sp.]